jgi:scyllo-inositol 2-dehydrogenase (NADP+)
MEPVKTAVLSYGMSGEIFHAPLIAALPGLELSAIVQRTSDRARERYPAVRILRDVGEVFDDSSIDLVIINTPNETHFDFASSALRAGKHVVVEKPFTVTVEEGQNLIQLASQKKRMLSVFQNRRFDGDFLTVKKIVESGVLGKLVEYEAHYDRFRNQIDKTTWKEQSLPGNGILYNLGSHMLDQALVLFGMPQYVDARVGIQREGGSVDDFYDIRLEYDHHFAIIKSSYLVKETMPRYILHGSEGSFTKFGIDPQEEDLKAGKDVRSPEWGVEKESEWGRLNTSQEGVRNVQTERGNYLLYYQSVEKAIRAGDEPAVTAEEALDVIRLIEACYESASSRKAVKLR